MTIEQLGWLSVQGAWKYVIHGPHGTTGVFVPATRSAHRFNAARDEALGRKRDKWGTNAGDKDNTIQRISTRPMYD